jgi:hypothetical protein
MNQLRTRMVKWLYNLVRVTFMAVLLTLLSVHIVRGSYSRH